MVHVEGALIVNGSFNFKSAGEILAWENRQAPSMIRPMTVTPTLPSTLVISLNLTLDFQHFSYAALAANGKIKIDGDGGPAHIEAWSTPSRRAICIDPIRMLRPTR
jgi:hypothetical protein